ncbi:MAG: hypothetical protein ABJC05_08465 [Pyrinomonadaceae bacterium]
MKTLMLLSTLLTLFVPGQNPAPAETSPVTVLGARWFKSRQAIEKPDSSGSVPAAAMIQANKAWERNRRVDAPRAGEPDPNADSMDGRRAAMEKNVQESRAPKPSDGFAYRAKLKNASTKTIEVLFWEYQFMPSANPATLSRRQFLCGVSIKPQKDIDVQGFSLSGPGDVVNVGSVANAPGNGLQERVVINRVEYADGTIWQRKDWNFGEVKSTVARAVQGPWAPGMCKGL